MLKTVGTSGQLTLGKKYSGRHFELEESANGELVLRPVRMVRESEAPVLSRAERTKRATKAPAFQIAEVEQLVMPGREQRNAGRE
jgi:hypothetical protein